MPRPKVRVMATKTMAIMGMVVVMVVVEGRPMAKPMPWMPINSRYI